VPGAPECSPVGDAELIRKFVNDQDWQAYWEYVVTHKRMVLGQVLRRGVPQFDAQDVVTDTFLSLAKTFESHPPGPGRAIDPILLRAARRRAADYWRARQRLIATDPDDLEMVDAKEPNTALPASTMSLLPDEVAASEEFHSRLFTYLGSLTPREQLVADGLLLGQAHKTLAAELGITQEQSRQLRLSLTRGIHKFMKAFRRAQS